ncbi:MAG: AAA family ATPase [Proteobacteria bacterium]|nr:AAA family ATPase [Pseudomonadota bacterium]
MDRRKLIENPYRPGAGQIPPIVSGRLGELRAFKEIILRREFADNVLVTGLRGVGKTVLLEEFRQIAVANDWLWVGNDLSESSSLTEERLALRILTDLASALGEHMRTEGNDPARAGRHSESLVKRLAALHASDASNLTFEALQHVYERAPGLPSDRLKEVLRRVTMMLERARVAGLVLAYDEAQCLADRATADEFPMSMLIETIAQLQKREGLVPCRLVLCGLPQVLDSLVETRTYTERMFRVMSLERLAANDTRFAILKPLEALMPPLYAPMALIEKVVDLTGGYPYLIQFFGRELVNQLLANGGTLAPDDFPSPETYERLDSSLFAARWSRTSDRQREILNLLAQRPSGSSEFSIKELEDLATVDGLAGSAIQSHVAGLVERGLIYRTRHGRYAFTIPMSETMILRRFRKDSQFTSGDSPDHRPPPKQPSVQPEPPRRKRWFR